MKEIKIGVAGCLGRMGSELVKSICSNSNYIFSGGFEHPKHPDLGKSFDELLAVETNLNVIDDKHEVFKNSNVVIDFTIPDSTLVNLDICLETKTPLVIGTTGLSEDIFNKIELISKNVAIFQSSNMSIAVNLLLNATKEFSKLLNANQYDVEIAEAHHKNKIDAPSGTAIVLGKAVAEGREENFKDKRSFDRTSSNNPRKVGDIGFAVTRGGEIAGEHTVSFIGKDDQIQLIHKANNRSIFVDGAIKAADWLIKQKNGFYTMKDIL